MTIEILVEGQRVAVSPRTLAIVSKLLEHDQAVAAIPVGEIGFRFAQEKVSCRLTRSEAPETVPDWRRR